MKILKRDEFILEIYNPMLEKKEYEELQVINEGKLKYLFGGDFGLFFNREWGKIDGDKNIIKAYKEMDSKLTGFATMKSHKRKICNKVRQELVNFADLWYEHIMNEVKEKDEDPEMVRSMEFEEDALKDGIENCKKKISEIADGDNQVIKWAQLLMDDMKIVINRCIKGSIKDEKVLKEMEEEEKKHLEEQDKLDKQAAKIQKTQLEEMEKERESLISNFGAKAISQEYLGDKAIKELCGEFNRLPDIAEEFNDKTVRSNGKPSDEDKKAIIDKLKNLISNDGLLAFKTIMGKVSESIDDGKVDDAVEKYNIMYPLMKMFYENLESNDSVKKFENVPAGSIQAMCLAVNSFIKNCVYIDENRNYTGEEFELELMAKCAIVSDGIVSYNLPLNDKGDGNTFTDFINRFVKNENKIEGWIKKQLGKNADDLLPENLKEDAQLLVKKIIDKAEKLKKEGEKKYDDEMSKFKLDIKNSEIEIE